ncbi:MAG: hypothetical protein NT173_15290, partial [Opitutales bacterium]|nr:hypothetical protein [Opitutales bacterium]
MKERSVAAGDGHEVAGVGVGVGEPPGDVAVAADHDDGQPRQGDARDAARRGGVPRQRGPVPDVGDGEVEVRVVGQQGGAAGGVGAGEGEAVAAGKGLGIAGLLGGEGGGRAGGRPGGGAGVPQVEDLFRRERGERGGGAVDGAIVGVRDLGEKRHAGDPELVPHRGQRQLVGSGRIL